MANTSELLPFTELLTSIKVRVTITQQNNNMNVMTARGRTYYKL